MKKIIISLTLILGIFSSLCGQITFGNYHKINDDWKFILGDPQNAESITFNDSIWLPIEIPHDWSVKEQLSPSLASCTGYLPGGIGWYRKTISIPVSKKGELVFLYFEGIYNRSEVFINGHLLGERPNGYISFIYDATSFIEYGKENTIAVRVDHSKSSDSRWYTGSGIYRNVWLIYSNQLHISQWGVFAYTQLLNKNQAILNVDVEIENVSNTSSDLIVINEIFSAESKSIAKTSKKITVASKKNSLVSSQLKIASPHFWDPENPYLYVIKTSLLENGNIIDSATTKTGIRSLRFDPDKGFALNGKWMKIKGVCLHHDAGVLGAAVPMEVWEKRLRTLKHIGCNAIRMSHNPQATDVYNLCDELGILIMDEAFDEWEFPKRKWIEGWNMGTPGFQGSYDFFEEWGSRDISDMVRRDRNHPSVFAWSIGNEVDYPNDPYSHPILDGTTISQPMFGGYKPENPDANRLASIAKKLVAEVKKCDTTRPVTAAFAGVIMSNETEYPVALDITGYNYSENSYKTDHEKYPGRIIFGSENRHSFNDWKIVRDHDYIFGQFLWTGIDYLGESGSWPSRGFYSGLLDFGGSVKPRGRFREALWSALPVTYIGTYPAPADNYKSMDAWPVWNYEEGQMIRVVCYTNAVKTKLMLNGNPVGEEKEYDDETGIISWDVPFEKGKLEAIGYDTNGIQTCNYVINSSKRADALTVQSDKGIIDKNKGLAFLTVQVVDENGVPVILSDDMVTCTVEGPAKLLGLEASNNRDMTDYTDNKHRLYHGRILAYIQATGTTGMIRIEFTSPWIKPAYMTIDVK